MPKNVLVVDDEEDIRAMLKMALQGPDCVVRTAADGREAIDEIDRQRPDLILLDLKMPRLNGYQLFAQLKSDETLSRIPVIVMTGLTRESDHDDMDWARRMHADGFITKPFDVEELSRRVRDLAAKFL